ENRNIEEIVSHERYLIGLKSSRIDDFVERLDFIFVSQEHVRELQKFRAHAHVFGIPAADDPDLDAGFHQNLESITVFDVKVACPTVAFKPKNSSIGHHTVDIKKKHFDFLQA